MVFGSLDDPRMFKAKVVFCRKWVKTSTKNQEGNKTQCSIKILGNFLEPESGKSHRHGDFAMTVLGPARSAPCHGDLL